MSKMFVLRARFPAENIADAIDLLARHFAAVRDDEPTVFDAPAKFELGPETLEKDGRPWGEQFTEPDRADPVLSRVGERPIREPTVHRRGRLPSRSGGHSI